MNSRSASERRATVATRFDRTLRVVPRGALAVQAEAEGVRVTIITRDETLDRLPSVGCVVTRPFTVFTEDHAWHGVLGAAWKCAGGVELQVAAADVEALAAAYPDEAVPLEAWLPVTVRDIYLPTVRVRARLYDLKYHCTPVARGGGPRAAGERKTCDHRRVDYGCGPCMAQWVRARAALLGIEVPHD